MTRPAARFRAESRARLVSEVRLGLLRQASPRLHTFLMMAVAGLAAFGCSVLALNAGLVQMSLRYPLAAVGGYLVFVGLIRLWISVQRHGWRADVDPLNITSEIPAELPGSPPTVPFSGGGSGGAGASGSWAAPQDHVGGRAMDAMSRTADRGKFGVDIDLDEAWPLVLAAACAVGGAIALAYVVYAAPILLAEVALDAAVVTTAYRRLRREDSRSWVSSTLRHTWLPALALVVMLFFAGVLLEWTAPEARSIGGVVRALAD